MTAGETKSFLPPWKLVETVAAIGLAVVARGAAHLIDDSAVLRQWMSRLAPRAPVAVPARARKPGR